MKLVSSAGEVEESVALSKTLLKIVYCLCWNFEVMESYANFTSVGDAAKSYHP